MFSRHLQESGSAAPAFLRRRQGCADRLKTTSTRGGRSSATTAARPRPRARALSFFDLDPAKEQGIIVC